MPRRTAAYSSVMKRPLIQSTLLAAVALALPLTLIGCNKSSDTGTGSDTSTPPTTMTDTNAAAAPSMDTNAPATNSMATTNTMAAPDTNAPSTNATMPATNSGQ